jgi:hypothetical protein
MRRVFLVVMCGIMLGVASPAFAAGSPSSSTYGGPANSQLTSVTSQLTSTTPDGPNSAKTVSASSLPFTGLDVGAIVVIAAGLLASGLALRVRSRSDVR